MSDELMTNFGRMKRNERLYSLITKVYLISCGSYLFIMFGVAVLSVFATDPMALLFAMIFKGSILCFGFAGVYCHNNLYAIIPAGVALLHCLIFFDMTTIPYLFIAVVMMILTLRANAVYDELSQLPGFPQFSERFEEQKQKSAQLKIKSEYQQSFEERLKTSKDDMDSLSAASGDLSVKASPENREYMDTADGMEEKLSASGDLSSKFDTEKKDYMDSV